MIANPVQIEGAEVIVGIAETKLGKRKYNRVHRVEGAWVFGGVERTVLANENGTARTQAGRAFMVRVDD